MAKLGEIAPTLKSILDSEPYDDREFRRGEIYYVDLEDIGYTTRHIQSKTRPALVIQNDIGNRNGQTIIVALLTSSFKKPYPFQYHTEIEGRESVIMFEQIMTIDKSRILEKLSELTYEQMKEADNRLMYSLALNRLSLENIQNIEVVSLVNRKTKTSEKAYFEIDIIFAYNQKRMVNISIEKLKKFNSAIDKDIDFDELKKLLDCCKGLNWLVNNSEV